MSRAAKGDGSQFKSGSGYRGYVTVNGKRKYFSARTKAEAAQRRRGLLTRRESGALQVGKSPTVEQWLRHWIENVAQLRPTTAQTHTWVLERRIVGSPIARIRLDALTVEDVEEWMTGLSVKPTSARRYLAPLRAALTAAMKRGHLGSNPVDRMELPQSPRPRTTSLSRADRDVILAAATGRNAARWHVALRIGLRPAEALGLTWPDFDAATRKLRIRHQLLRAKGHGLYLQGAAKTAAGERTITLPRTLADLLVRHRGEQLAERAELGDEWVGWDFDGQPIPLMFAQLNGRPIDARMDAKAWRDLLASVGLANTNRYISRHTAATHALDDSKGDVAVVAKMLGHADPSFTYRTYVHPLEQRESDLADAMDAPYVAPYDPGVERHGADVRPGDAQDSKG